MSLETVKRIASRLLKKGKNKIRIKQEDVPRASDALTVEDVKVLVQDGVVYSKPIKGVSRARAKIKHAQLKKGRRKGRGSKKGKKFSNVSTKELWIKKVRIQRELLKNLYADGRVDSTARKKIYYLIKGNMFKNKSAMMLYLTEHKLLLKEEDNAEKKLKPKKKPVKKPKPVKKSITKKIEGEIND
ncbi:50S ribosomal protein L19e [Candidatus Micrarchaeota archaeon]|nr:50S ribosomal protein L19e [Candidatus Micrarchaeota archaeon]